MNPKPLFVRPFVGGVNKNSLAGFTLVEIMVGGTLSMLLGLALFQIVAQSQQMADVMITQVTQNNRAREVFEWLADGGVRAGGVPTTDLDRIAGYHGRNIDPWGGNLTRQNFRLQLSNGTNLLTTRAAQPSFTLTCSGNDDRVYSCDAKDEQRTVDGYIDGFASDAVNRIVGRTREITWTVVDPHRVPRDGVDPRFIQSEYTDFYWTIFNLNVP